MGPEGLGGNIVPPVRWSHVRAAGGIERIEDATARLAGLAAHEQQGLSIGVVEETMRDARAGGERREIAGDHPVEVPVNPDIDFPVNDVDKLLLVLLRVRPRRPRSRGQPLEVDANPLKPRLVANPSDWPHRLGALRIDMRSLGDVGG